MTGVSAEGGRSADLVAGPPERSSASQRASRSSWRVAGFVLSIVAVALFATQSVAVLGLSNTLMVVDMLVLGLFAASVAFLFTVVGVASFGQASFYGIGAYSLVIIGRDHVENALLAGVIAIFVGTAAAMVIGLFVLRVSGIRYAILTLAIGQAIYAFVTSRREYGGDSGVVGYVRGGPIDLTVQQNLVALAVAAIAAGFLALARLRGSRFGIEARAVRADPVRALALGIPVHRFYYAGFVLASSVASLAGSLHGLVWGLATPQELGWALSGEAYIVSLIGGIGTLIGPFIGAAVYLGLVDYISAITAGWMLWIGLMLVILVIVAPRGLFGIAEAIRDLRRRLHS